MPNATARGGNAFSAMHTAPPIPLNNTLDNPTIVDETSTNDSAGTDTLINPMDIDRHDSDTTSVFTSNSFGKHKLDVIASDEELNTSGSPIPSTIPNPRFQLKRRLPAYLDLYLDPETLHLQIPLKHECSQQAPK